MQGARYNLTCFFHLNSRQNLSQLIMPIELRFSLQVAFLYVKTNPYFWSHSHGKKPLLRNKKLIPMCTFLKFHTHLEENSKIISKCFWQVFKGLKSCIFKTLNFSWTSLYLRVPYHLNKFYCYSRIPILIALKCSWVREERSQVCVSKRGLESTRKGVI